MRKVNKSMMKKRMKEQCEGYGLGQELVEHEIILDKKYGIEIKL